MHSISRHHTVLPLPSLATKKNQGRVSRYPLRRSEAVWDAEMPSPFSQPFPQWRVGALVAVVVGVVLSVLMGWFFLFLGAPLPHVPFPSSSTLPLLGQIGVGGGAGIILWSVLSALIKGKRKERPAQYRSIVPRAALVSVGGGMTLPPEPADHRTGEPCSPCRTLADHWMFSAWDAREALHIRQRVRLLQLHYAWA